MTADEAKQALKEGKNVRCVKWFLPDSYISKEKYDCWVKSLGADVFEEFKDDKWEIVE